MLKITLLLSMLMVNPLAYGAMHTSVFSTSPLLRSKVAFWKKVFTKVSNKEGLLHDSNDLNIIYKKINVSRLSKKALNRKIKSEKRKISYSLLNIYRKKKRKLNRAEVNLVRQIGGKVHWKKYKSLSANIRFQRGLKEKFVRGIELSGRYLPFIKREFNKAGIPQELAYLPHVESSFNYKAYSKVGAAGIWQFIRSTGRIYMKVNKYIDQRKDPLSSSKAAIKVLKENYKLLKSWPLAITAYNHGPGSLIRAVNRLNTRSITKIIQKHRSRRFGFASKNFYSSFLAAYQIAKNPYRYFKKINIEPAVNLTNIKLSRTERLRSIYKKHKISKAVFAKYNPAFSSRAYKKNIRVAKGFVVRLPGKSKGKKNPYLQRIPLPKSYYKVVDTHRVKKGESLYSIAQHYNVSLNKIIALNDISNPKYIRAGATLRLPRQG